VTAGMPPSELPPALSQSTHPKIDDPAHPSGVIPSTGGSVYDIDLMQFEGSGQPWRRPGSDITQYFNFGFDEATYPRFLRFRAEMMAGREAMVCHYCSPRSQPPQGTDIQLNAPMGHIPNEVLNMVQMSMPPLGPQQQLQLQRAQQAQEQQAQQQQQQQQAMQQMQQMQQMLQTMQQQQQTMGQGGQGQNGQVQGGQEEVMQQMMQQMQQMQQMQMGQSGEYPRPCSEQEPCLHLTDLIGPLSD
jgi:pre-mRNA 3'-end-processing factor FIP1